MKSKNTLVALPIWTIVFIPLALQHAVAQEGIFERISGKEVRAPLSSEKYAWCASFFSDEALLQMELQADFAGLVERKEAEVYQPGTMIIYLNEQEFVRINVRIQSRGYSRLKACRLPPLKIDFSHSGTELKPVKVLDELKMVTLCREGEVQEQYLLTEYLVYRIYHLITDYSLGVRRGRIRYINESDGAVMYEGPVFFIEDIDKMADRFDAREYQKAALERARLDSLQTGIMTVFQFMIGNLDWSIEQYHNVKVIEAGQKGEGILLPVPYDFDLSRMVDAIYTAAPPPDPGIAPPPPGRIYRGPCFRPEQIEVILDRYRSRREAVFALLGSLEGALSESKAAEIRNSLESFYRLIDSPQQVEAYFIRYCH